MKNIIIFLSFVLFPLISFGVSFDCSKASSSVEKKICSDQILGKLDEALAENYKGMLASDFGGSKKLLKERQLKWLSNRNKCTTTKCLIEMYRKRVDETCEYGVITGVHPECTLSEDIASNATGSQHSLR